MSRDRSGRRVQARGRALAVALALSALTGCAATTLVESSPPGARVEIDNDYVGRTPLEHEWSVSAAQRYNPLRWIGMLLPWNWRGPRLGRTRIVRVLPPRSDLFLQSKVLPGGSTPPTHVFFDLTIPPEKP